MSIERKRAGGLPAPLNIFFWPQESVWLRCKYPRRCQKNCARRVTTQRLLS